MRGVSLRDAADLQGRLWAPGQSLPIAWYDAADLSTISCPSGAIPNPWRDKSGNGKTANLTVSAVQPTLTPNYLGGLYGMNFAAVNGGWSLASSIATGPISWAGVVEREGTALDRVFFSGIGGALKLYWNSGHVVRMDRSAELSLIITGVVAAGWHIVTAHASAAGCLVAVDGTVLVSNATNPALTQPITEMGHDQAAFITSPFRGGMAEQVFWTRALSTAERQRNEGYLAWKWDGGRAGLLVGQLPASHPYKNSPPLTGDAALRARLRWFGADAPTQPIVVLDTGGSGNQAHGGSSRGSGRRNINDDPEAFSELLKEWRARKGAPKSPNIPDAISSIPKATETAYDEAPVDDFQDHLSRVEAEFDRSMVAYEEALGVLERAKVQKAAKAQKAKQAAIRQAAIEQEELARQQAMQLAIEWELARLAYEDFLEEEDEIMLLS